MEKQRESDHSKNPLQDILTEPYSNSPKNNDPDLDLQNELANNIIKQYEKELNKLLSLMLSYHEKVAEMQVRPNNDGLLRRLPPEGEHPFKHRERKELHWQCVFMIAPIVRDIKTILNKNNISESKLIPESKLSILYNELNAFISHGGVAAQSAAPACDRVLANACDTIGGFILYEDGKVSKLPYPTKTTNQGQKTNITEKEPSKEAIQAYRLYYSMGETQGKIAEIMKNELKRPISQGQVSRWIKQTKAWRRREGLPTNENEPPEINAMDSSKLDMGSRTDGRRTGDPHNIRNPDSD